MIKTLKDYAEIERHDLLKRAFDHDGDERFNAIFDTIIQLTNNHCAYRKDIDHAFYNRIKILINAAKINEFSDDDYYKEAFDDVLVIAKLMFGEEIRQLTLKTMEIDNSIELLTKRLSEKIEANQKHHIQNTIDNIKKKANEKY